jgi:short-subunit dehydrogenase
MKLLKDGSGETALITGASAGIGEVLAACFANGGYDLVLVARSVDKLQEIAIRLRNEYGVKVWVEPADLSRPDAAERLASKIKRRKLAIDVLVNNAGVLELGLFAQMTPQQHQAMISLNIAGLTAMLAHFMPPMVARGHGRILNVASVAAFQPLPALATYAASKAYVLSLTEALSEELKGTGVTITALCPGFTATNMLQAAKDGNDNMAKMPEFMMGSAQQVAREGYVACLAGTVIKVPGMLNLTTTVGMRAVPKWLVRRITGSLGRLIA